ncbi:crossover junction endodeoxyribonuclease RuvC [Rubellicoccus peritrichatus]|uniref:Crossover junction endodeoxyribonuclease RuvC n=1 Tax=Rubellicoccus peritrichatus TaxID=3080537 RepID=A0AAQ3QTU3_9BACT|nr:crossover junction endodeoxyribonuclease RuvC [Puniceicoccus sp. CR14]WOO41701.1 crossover junction endodeoxyribonuclease RuvC [Puniceicoccus sp. CR14]
MARSARALWTAKLTGKPTPGASPVPVQLAGPANFRGVILGVDPSLRGTGLAVVDLTHGVEKAQLKGSWTIKLKPKLSMHECLGEIAKSMTQLIETHEPDCIVLEQTIYVQNFQTAQILGAARGAAIAPGAMRGIEIHEYAPLRIKQAVVGFGRASKVQVSGMVRQLLKISKDLPSDESDAAAAALCHAMTYRGNS